MHEREQQEDDLGCLEPADALGARVLAHGLSIAAEHNVCKWAFAVRPLPARKPTVRFRAGRGPGAGGNDRVWWGKADIRWRQPK
jgi:hypothetical protein